MTTNDTPTPGATLPSEALEILKHTSRTGRYVTDPDAETHLLTTFGYLQDHDAQALAGGMHYYTITTLGRAALRNHQKAVKPIVAAGVAVLLNPPA